jgi:hypothetical protein
MTNTKKTPHAISPGINRIFYGLFVASGIFFLFFSEDNTMAIAQFGIALIFDPFSPEVPFPKRPFYQKAWLTVHLLLLFASLGWVILH